MCLSSVKEQYDEPSTLIQGGYKDLGSGSKPQFPSFPLKGKKDVPLDQWLQADTSTKIVASDGCSYESGFHIFEEEDKRGPSLRRVFFRRVSTRGLESYKTVVIARELYVPSKPNGWPPKESSKPPAGSGGSSPKPNPSAAPPSGSAPPVVDTKPDSLMDRLKGRISGKGGNA